jgi:hypothetical protein
MKWDDETVQLYQPPEGYPTIRTATLKGYLLFDASQLAWQLASLAESARNMGLEPPEVAISGPGQLQDWIVKADSRH